MTLGVAILLGGQSARMGEPKHLIQLGGEQTLMDTMVTLASTLSETVITVGRQYDDLPYVIDRRHGAGPLAGVEALLLSDICKRYLIIGCDMPLLTHQTMQRLIDVDCSAAFNDDDRVYGLPCVIDSMYATVCTACLDDGMRSLKGFLKRIECELISATSETIETLSSLNTPSDVHNFTLKNGCS